MELDEFAALFNTSAGKIKAVNYNIMETIYTDSKGPLAMLEKNLKITLFIFPFVVILFGGSFLNRSPLPQSPTMWLLFAILSIEFLFSLFNYVIVKKIQQPMGNIKENLINKISRLQNLYTRYLYIHQGLYLLMAILLELTMYFNLDADFNGWSKVNPALRFAAYVAFLAIQFVIKRASLKKSYGQYLDKLNSLVSQME
ncbi:MAG TPA: hypothetical protein VGN20_15460 [Mucilaginibacter sp.]|jgi:hypothetical protein